jgi:hypothetical protein
MVRQRGNSRDKFFSVAVPNGSPLAAYPLPSSRFDSTPLNVFTTPIAEVIYFLRPNGRFTAATQRQDAAGNPIAVNPLPLYNLYRRVVPVVPDNNYATPISFFAANQYVPALETALTAAYVEYSCLPAITHLVNTPHTGLYFNTASDLTVPLNRFGMVHDPDPKFVNANNPTGYPYGGAPRAPAYTVPGTNLSAATYLRMADQNAALAESDLLLTDVLSFDVRLDTPETLTRAAASQLDPFVDLFDSQALLTNVAPLAVLQSANPNFTGANARVFDTWTSYGENINNATRINYTNWNTAGTTTSLPIRPRILALQISIRAWDTKTQQARQVTFIQDM